MLLDKRLEVKKPKKTEDGRGGWTSEMELVDTVWGKVVPLSAMEIMKYRSIVPEVTHRIILRYKDGLVLDNEFVLYNGSRKFTISGFVNIAEKNRFDDILASEVLEKV